MTYLAERKAEEQPREGGGAEAENVLLPVTVMMPGTAAVASGVWSQCELS